MSTLKAVFDEHFTQVKFDSRLAKALYQYQLNYINSNHEHLQFFGSNLLGAHVVRFKDSDVNRLFNEVLDVDLIDLTADIRKLDTINHTWKVTGDITNLTLMYVIHRFLNAELLSQEARTRAAYDTALIFFYRCVAALISYFFKYPSDPKVAQMAYANLSNKFLIKKLGSWHKVMEYRAEDLTDVKGIHYRNLARFLEDELVIYAISDGQGRIRDLIKNYYAVFEAARVEGASIGSTSSTYLDADGEETIKEKTKSTEAYVTYMRNIVTDRHTFVKDNLISIVMNINANSSFRIVKGTLNWMSEHTGNPKLSKMIDEFVSLVVVQSMFMIQNNMQSKHLRDYPYILITLKNLYLSTRTTDPEIDRIRELGLKIVHEANGKHISDALAFATRTSLLLYISLRSLVGQNANH